MKNRNNILGEDSKKIIIINKFFLEWVPETEYKHEYPPKESKGNKVDYFLKSQNSVLNKNLIGTGRKIN